MTAYVALLRGINVGGNNILPMRELKSILASLGCEGVQTYIQSGNAVFRSRLAAAELRTGISSAIRQSVGFAPHVQLLTVTKLQAVMLANPFPAAVDTPQLLHVWFLAAKAGKADTATMEKLRSKTERYKLSDDALYLHAPDGIGRSRLASRVERCLGVETTARNWRTVSKIAAMAAAATG